MNKLYISFQQFDQKILETRGAKGDGSVNNTAVWISIRDDVSEDSSFGMYRVSQN